MKIWLFGLGLVLLCSVHAVDDSEYEKIKQFAGTHHIQVVATNCKCLLKHKDKMKMTLVTLTPQEPGRVTMDTSLPMPGRCKKISMTFTKNENGHYSHKCEWGDKTIQEVDTTHEGTLAIKAIHEKNGKTCKLWTLLARDRVIEEAVKDAFTHDALAAGFTKDEIMTMPPEVACVESQ